MKRYRRNPVEKKALSYAKDSHRRYGHNKTARKAVRVRKADHHRSYRRSVHQVLAADNPEDVDDRAHDIPRKRWRKFSDARLVQHLDHTWSGSARTRKEGPYAPSPARKLARLILRRERGQDAETFSR